MLTPRTYQLAAWAVLALVFVASYAQGPDFASTKETATAFGALIGLASFFAWLAVEEEEEEDGGGSGEEEELASKGAKRKAD